MTISFSDLVNFYSKADFSSESGYVSYCIENESELTLINQITDDNNFDDAQIEVISGTPTVGSIMLFNINDPNMDLGWLYLTFKEFIKGDFSRVFSNQARANNPYYIKELNYYSSNEITPNLIVKYNVIKRLLYQLGSMCVYSDIINKKIIFFSKHTFALSYDMAGQLNDFNTLICDMNDDLVVAINEFCDWLGDDQTSKHIGEKKSMLAFGLAGYKDREKLLHIFDVIQDIKNLDTNVRSQYDLYLEDFKYEKFVKKLEENSEKFVNRINESISKVLSQVLALPIAAVAPIILKTSGKHLIDSSQSIIYFGLLSYAIICYFALIAQKEVLDNIAKLVNSSKQKDKIPTSLKIQWEEDKKQINSLIKKQEHLYWIMILVIYLVVIYSSYNLSYIFL